MTFINNYYTPFIKSKLGDKTEDYKKEIKELDKQLDRIKTAYIKGVIKLEDFDKEIKQIEYQKFDLEKSQKEVQEKLAKMQTVLDNIEKDIYSEDGFDFEIICPYCNYEFTADIEDESKEEIQCPECHNAIELDWNMEEEGGCSGSCSHCAGCVAEDDEEYKLDDDEENNNENEDEDM